MIINYYHIYATESELRTLYVVTPESIGTPELQV